ncbi:hypothetical protein [Streptomyces sp. NPDC002520]
MDRVGLSELSPAGRVHFVLGWALCTLSLLLAAATWLPGADKVPFAAVGAVFGTAFPVFGIALLRAMFSAGGRTLFGRANTGRMLRFLRSLPTGLKWAYAVVLAALLLAVVTAGGARDAKTDGKGGHYYTRWNNTQLRSEQVPISEDEYDRATKAQARIFASGAALFHSVGGLLVLVSAVTVAPAKAVGPTARRIA